MASCRWQCSSCNSTTSKQTKSIADVPFVLLVASDNLVDESEVAQSGKIFLRGLQSLSLPNEPLNEAESMPTS